MAYFDFDYVTDPPNDETVDEVTQLNNNWQEVATKIDRWNRAQSNIIAPIPVGTEAMDPGGSSRIALWDGTSWLLGLNHDSSWGNWATFGLRSPIVERSGWTPVARVNPWKRLVALSGGVQINATADAWNTGTDVEITTDTAFSSSLAPVGGLAYFQTATAQITAANGFASAVIKVQSETTPARTSITARWQGDAGGGNFVMLDGIQWWY